MACQLLVASSWASSPTYFGLGDNPVESADILADWFPDVRVTVDLHRSDGQPQLLSEALAWRILAQGDNLSLQLYSGDVTDAAELYLQGNFGSSWIVSDCRGRVWEYVITPDCPIIQGVPDCSNTAPGYSWDGYIYVVLDQMGHRQWLGVWSAPTNLGGWESSRFYAFCGGSSSYGGSLSIISLNEFTMSGGPPGMGGCETTHWRRNCAGLNCDHPVPIPEDTTPSGEIRRCN